MKFIVSTAMILFFGFTSHAKDLTHRLGIGYKNNTTLDLPTLAAVYYPTMNMGLTGGVGVDTKKDYNSFQAMAGIRYIIYPETNMNFYGAGQFALVNYETPADGKKNGVEVSGLFGVEFFLTGLENLGWTFEAGVSLATAGSSRFRTVGDSPFRAGMIFYF